QHYMDSGVPCVLVSSKADEAEVAQQYGMTPAEFCYKHRLPPPMPFSTLHTGTRIYSKLAWAAMYAYVYTHTHPHTHINTLAFTYTFTHTNTDIRIHTKIQEYSRIHKLSLSHIHTYTQTHTRDQ